MMMEREGSMQLNPKLETPNPKQTPNENIPIAGKSNRGFRRMEPINTDQHRWKFQHPTFNPDKTHRDFFSIQRNSKTANPKPSTKGNEENEEGTGFLHFDGKV